MFTVNKNSWHYRWYVMYQSCLQQKSKEDIEKYTFHFPKDFCSYWRAVLLWPAIRIFLNILFYVLFGVVLYMTGWAGIVGIGMFGGMLTVGAGVLAAGIFVIAIVKTAANKASKAVTSDDMIAKVYSTYKENYCPFVEYKD